jgi:sn-glycerol 3-phosphate transport system permease protein
MDGAGPLRFLWDVLIPLSKTNIAALATIMFVYAWNQYLWPLLVITDRANYGMVVVQLSDLVPDQLTTGGGTPTWHLAMAATLVVMLPPIAIVIFMQRWFVRGLINTDK